MWMLSRLPVGTRTVGRRVASEGGSCNMAVAAVAVVAVLASADVDFERAGYLAETHFLAPCLACADIRLFATQQSESW